MDSMMTAHPNAPAFYFYSPDMNPESRQHGRFIPQQHQLHQHHQHHQHHQQHAAMQQMSMLPIVAPLPSTPVYSRPGSSCSQPPLLPKGYGSVPILPSTLTPVASPMPIAPKPTIVLDTELCETEGLWSPSTPPLSSSGSAISSPGSCDMLQTPLNPMFSGLDGKESCGMDGELESFPSLDWSTCASPPLTPGKLASSFAYFAHLLFFWPFAFDWYQTWEFVPLLSTREKRLHVLCFIFILCRRRKVQLKVLHFRWMRNWSLRWLDLAVSIACAALKA
jgi:hypothetical protein